MWVAICTNKECGWNHIAHSKLAAMILADGHQYERYQDDTHPVHVVDIPVESSSPSDISPDARHTR